MRTFKINKIEGKAVPPKNLELILKRLWGVLDNKTMQGVMMYLENVARSNSFPELKELVEDLDNGIADILDAIKGIEKFAKIFPVHGSEKFFKITAAERSAILKRRKRL
jgi:hypothetical protein